MERVIPTLITLALLIILMTLAGLGWRNRLRRQAGIAALPEVPALGEPTLTVVGQYVVTTSANDWLDRIAVHGLGIRTNSTLTLHPEGILLQRNGARDLFIGADRLNAVRTESGMVGKFVEKGGLVVLTWELGEQPVDTAFRTRRAEDKQPLIAAVTKLLPPEPQENIKER